MVYYPIKILNTAPICSPLLKSPEDMWDVNIFHVPLNKRCLLLLYCPISSFHIMLVYAGRWTNHPCSSAPCNQIFSEEKIYTFIKKCEKRGPIRQKEFCCPFFMFTETWSVWFILLLLGNNARKQCFWNLKRCTDLSPAILKREFLPHHHHHLNGHFFVQNAPPETRGSAEGKRQEGGAPDSKKSSLISLLSPTGGTVTETHFWLEGSLRWWKLITNPFLKWSSRALGARRAYWFTDLS